MGLILDTLYCATLIPHYIWHRFKTDKYGTCAPEKLGRINFQPKQQGQKRLWLHAVSVGETIAAKPLVNLFKKRFPDWDIKISTTTQTGREVAIKNFGEENVFYFPLDIRSIVNRTFDIIKPDLIILMELEIWPHFLDIAEHRNIPVAVSNVRITEKSFRNFKRLGNLSKKVLNQISLWASQSENYSNILSELGVDENKINTVGSLKYDGLDFSEDKEKTEKLLSELGGGRIFLAGSTHEGEDEIILEAFKLVRDKCGNDIKLLLVPRHPERCDNIIKIIPQEFSCARRSEGTVKPDTDIIIGDTMGELAGMYRVAEVVFVAGSLSEKVGGHNMLEPATFAKPVVYGPYTFNFKEPDEILTSAAAVIKLPDTKPQTLADAIINLLEDKNKSTKMGIRAKEVCQKMQGATEKTIDLIVNLLNK